MPLKGFKLGKAKLILDKILMIPILPRKNGRPICPVCGKRGPTYDTQPVRSWRHLAGFGIRVIVEYAPRRVKCRNCHRVITEQMPWSMGKCHLTKPFIYQLALWARELSWEQVARLFEVDWSQVKAAVESAVEFGLERRDTDNVTLLGIDEISRRKGHRYLTQVYEITEGRRRLLWSGEGRSKETLKAFFQYWGPERSARIKGICCDMWNPYVEVIKEYAPQATIVFDKFHIVRHLNDAVDQVRRQEADELSKKGDNLLRNTRYIWLKNPENLTALQQIKLHQLAGQSLKTHRAYQIKRAFQAIWDSSDRETAAFAFNQWFWWATHSRLKSMSKLAWSMQIHKEQILAYFILQINNSIVEGLNNKAKVIMRRSFGFHSPEVCKLALLHCLGNLELPTL